MRICSSTFAIACVTAIAGACVDTTPLAPHSDSMPIRAAVTRTDRPTFHPNSEKYRDAGFHPATGRSGSAVVSARALRDKSGTTDVELTTGTFDAGPEAGTLSRVQVKAFTPSGALAFTNNYSGSSSTASYPYTTLPHGTGVQVQSVVTGTGDPRSDVVTVATNVYLRPDLYAWYLQAPGKAPVGRAVNIQGFIYEQNGEVGARADCVLYVDGAAVDRGAGIWVDAAGGVECFFTHVFTELRTYALEVRAENVSPRDFDDSNNRITGSIDIVTPSPFQSYSFQAWAIQDSAWWHDVSTLLTWEGNLETWDQIYTRQGTTQFATFNGTLPRAFDYTRPITLRGEMSTNGATVNTVNDTYASLPYSDWQGAYCDYRYNFDTRGVTYICVAPGDGSPNSGSTYIQYDWSGADIHYTSTSYVYYWDPSGELHESWYSDAYTDFAPMVTFGPDFTGRFSIQGVGDPEPISAEATVRLEPTDLRFDWHEPSCDTVPASPGCFELHEHTWGVMGYTDYRSAPATP